MLLTRRWRALTWIARQLSISRMSQPTAPRRVTVLPALPTIWLPFDRTMPVARCCPPCNQPLYKCCHSTETPRAIICALLAIHQKVQHYARSFASCGCFILVLNQCPKWTKPCPHFLPAPISSFTMESTWWRQIFWMLGIYLRKRNHEVSWQKRVIWIAETIRVRCLFSLTTYFWPMVLYVFVFLLFLLFSAKT